MKVPAPVSIAVIVPPLFDSAGMEKLRFGVELVSSTAGAG